MAQFFSNKKLIIFLASIILLVALIGFSMRDRDSNISWPEQFVTDIVGWTQSVFYKPANYVAGFFKNVNELKHLYEENKLLKSRLDEYGQLSADLTELKHKYNILIAATDKEGNLLDYTVRHATVVARSPDRWYQIVVINKGLQSGVKPGMAVISPQGFIGKVVEAAPFYSTVQLISNLEPTNRVSAIVLGDRRIFGLIEGYDPEQERLLFKKIPIDVEVKVGQSVITSGMGGVFPEGLLIGTIEDVVPDEYGLTQTAYVKPAADLYDISHIMVLERTTPFFPEDMVDGEEE